MESDEGVAKREKLIEEIGRGFDEEIAKITDPFGEQEEIAIEKLMENPLYAAGIRSFERMRWDMESGLDPFAT